MLNDELEQKLLERFPWSAEAVYYIGDGWFQIILNMYEEIENLYKGAGIPIDIQVDEINEKYGGMRVHFHSNGSGKLEGFQDIIRKYEDLSEKTCDACGAEGSIREIGGWLSAYCDPCYKVDRAAHEERVNKIKLQAEWSARGLCHGCGSEGSPRDIGGVKLIFCDPCFEADKAQREELWVRLGKFIDRQ